MNRRELLQAAVGAAAPVADPWSRAEAIQARIRPPRFPGRDFDIARSGAAGDGEADSTDAIRRAIAECRKAGGGRVVVPPGRFRTGPLHLSGGVNLHLLKGARLEFDPDPARYLPAVFTRWEGVECMNYTPFIYASGHDRVAVTGEGTLDGRADCRNWWPWKGRKECGWSAGEPNQEKARARLFRMAEEGVPPEKRAFGAGDFLRPNFIQFYRCRDVLVEGVEIVNSPMWEIHPVFCQNVTVRRVRISSHGPNNDGCNPESSSGVLIEDCDFDTGDDCIALKSGRNADGRRLAAPCEDVVIRGCRMKDGHGGVTIGSEISGGARNIFVEKCRMDSPNLDRALRIKTNSVRGGTIESVYLRDITVGQVADAVVHIDFHYEEGNAGKHRPAVRDIELRRVTCARSKYSVYIRAYPDAPVRDVRLLDSVFEKVLKPDVVEHVEGLVRKNVTVNGRYLDS